MQKLLDFGYVDFVESWGSDERIIESARQSTSGGFTSWEPYGDHPKGDAGLLRYLWKHKHLTPFEMCGLTIEVQAPLMVFREWQRHRTQSYNELSARYTPIPNLNYVPTKERLLGHASDKNKQASTVAGVQPATEKIAEDFNSELESLYGGIERFYQKYLNGGIPKELARLALPVGRYSRMRASANLRNWLAFLTLRLDKGAQYEIRVYAEAVSELVKEKFPRTYELFAEGLDS